MWGLLLGFGHLEQLDTLDVHGLNNMSNDAGIYKIENKINGKVYYGSAMNGFIERWANHKSQLKNNKHGNVHLQAAWNKYGADNFEFVIILNCPPEDCLIQEQALLDKYFDGCVNCYNICPVAENTTGRKVSEETRKKISVANTGKVHSDETRKKISKINKGKFVSEQTRAKMSLAQIGNKKALGAKRAPATIIKMSNAQKLDSNRRSIAMAGDKNHFYGKKHSEEAKQKIRDAAKARKVKP